MKFQESSQEKLQESFDLVFKLLPTVTSKNEAYDLYKGPLLSAIKLAIEEKRFDIAFRLEVVGYSNLIKKYEYPEHYEQCFNSSDSTLGKIANFYVPNKIEKKTKEEKDNKKVKKISFFIHTLLADNELINIFSSFLECLEKDYLES